MVMMMLFPTSQVLNKGRRTHASRQDNPSGIEQRSTLDVGADVVLAANVCVDDIPGETIELLLVHPETVP